MTGPLWLAPLLAVLMLLVAAGSAIRLVLWRLRGRAAEPEADALHAVMGVAMAGMLEPRIGGVPNLAWEVVFAAAAAWFCLRAISQRGARPDVACAGRPSGDWRCLHPAVHGAESAVMIYMLVPLGTEGRRPAMAMPGMSGPASTANPALSLVLAAFMLCYILWVADRLVTQSRARAAGRPAGAQLPASGTARGVPEAALTSRLAACSKIAMGLAMGYMLLMTL
jgi:hypothetical protein